MKSRGLVSLVFDDGYTSVFSNIVPLLEKYALPGVFAIALDGNRIAETENRPVTPLTDWLALASRGHEIAAHSVTHRNLTTLSTAELEIELDQPVTQLHATTLVYPGGAFDAQVKQMAALHYQAARTTRKGFSTLPPIDRYALPTYNFTKDNFSAWQANLLASWAWLTDSWLLETYHLVGDPDPAMVHNVPLADFEQHLKFLSWLPVRVDTIKNILV